MNCVNKSSIGAGGRTKARPGAAKIKLGAKGISISKVKVAHRLVAEGIGIPKSILEEIELPKRVDLLESFLAYFLVMLEAVIPCKNPCQWDDRPIV